jgi:hypothetical protein
MSSTLANRQRRASLVADAHQSLNRRRGMPVRAFTLDRYGHLFETLVPLPVE